MYVRINNMKSTGVFSLVVTTKTGKKTWLYIVSENSLQQID